MESEKSLGFVCVADRERVEAKKSGASLLVIHGRCNPAVGIGTYRKAASTVERRTPYGNSLQVVLRIMEVSCRFESDLRIGQFRVPLDAAAKETCWPASRR